MGSIQTSYTSAKSPKFFLQRWGVRMAGAVRALSSHIPMWPKFKSWHGCHM